MNEARNHDYMTRLERALHFLDTHTGAELDMDRLADLVCFSRFHFQRVFAGVVGEAPGAYLRRIRLDNARRMIMERPARSLTEIAFECGFTSSTLFSRMFKTEFHCSPRDIKKMATLVFDDSSRLAKGQTREESKQAQMPSCLSGEMRVIWQEAEYIAFIRCTGYGPSLGIAYFRLFNSLHQNGLLDGRTRTVGISFDDPSITERKKCRYYAAATLPLHCPEPRGLSTMILPAGKKAMVRFCGELERLDEAINWIFSSWLPCSGYFPADIPLHQFIHKNPFRDGGDQYELDIALPLLD
jgi:AraC family transcriptional regulator